MVFEKLRHWGRPETETPSFLLDAIDPAAPLGDRIDWLERLLRWIRSSPSVPHGFDAESGALPQARLRFLLHLLDRNPVWKAKLGRMLGTLVRDTYGFRLFARAGLGRERGFVAEAGERLLRRLLPQPPEETDLYDVLWRVFEDASDVQWLAGLSRETMQRIVAIVAEDGAVAPGTKERWHEEVVLATWAVAARVATLGSSAEVLQRLSPDCRENPYLALVTDGHDRQRLREAAEHCRLATQALYDELETSGASVSLVYTLDTIQSALERLRGLLDVLEARGEERFVAYTALAARLAQQSVDQRSLGALFHSNVRLVAKKITERTGASGEHYIARNREQYRAMIRAGIGGGAVMVFVCLAKLEIHGLGLPPFMEFCLFSLNYVTGFLVLQRLGFTLATKQPSATAAALAAKLESLDEEGEIRAFVDEACRMARTQVAALIGNLLLLVPLAVGVALGFQRLLGIDLLNGAEAQRVLASLHPLTSFSLANAVLTGVLLWLSSLAAGWLENSIVYRRIPQAVAKHPRLRRALGASRAERIGEVLLRNATLVGGNVSLGVMMGAVSILGPFLGLPIDVRHVTLSAASLTFAATKLSQVGVPWTQFIAPATGVLCIGALNFAVAYALAFIVAARSRDLSMGTEKRLLRALRARIRHRPLDFLLPRERLG